MKIQLQILQMIILHTLYKKNIEILLNNLQSDSHTLLMWFDNNFLKLNADKCKLLMTKHEDEVSITLDKEVIKGNKTVKLLGIKIDNKLDFNNIF